MQILFIFILVGVIIYAFFSSGGLKVPKTETVPTKISAPSSPVSPPVSPPVSLPPASTSTKPLVQDTAPPKRSKVSPQGALPYQTKQINLSLETDEIAVCRYEDVKGLDYGKMKVFSSTASTTHSTQVTGLSEGQQYAFYVKCQDRTGNTNQDDVTIAFSVKKAQDTIPPVTRNAYPFEQTFSAGTKEVMMGISTDEPATCRHATASGKDYSSMSGRFNPYDATKMYHTASVKKLENGKNYNFYVRCSDLVGNKNMGDVLISFNIAG